MMLMAKEQRPVSLRAGLLLRLGVVLVLLLVLDAVASYFTALHFANLVYDRWLVDSNRSLATAVHTRDGQIFVDLPQAALDVFQFDAVDTTYYRIDSNRRGYIAGEMGLTPIYQRPRTTVPHPEHRVYPHLLRDLVIDRPNQVWCADLTYIPMRRGFLYLVAIMDWATRKVLAWRVSNTMDVEFCLEALEEALARFGKPEIFNTDQGSQFTSPRFTGVLRDAGIRISMDGRGRWMDNVFIERLWRSLKYECVYLHAFETGSELRAGLSRWIGYYNARRPHSTLAGRTPDEAYRAMDAERSAA